MVTRRDVLSAFAGAGAGLLGAGSLGCRGARPATEVGMCPTISGARVRWIVPHGAGGGYDEESRLIAPFLERRLRAEIAVENLTGAGGILGARTLAGAAADGHTLGILGVSGLIVAAATGERGVPDVAAFTILGRVSRSWHVWATGRGSSIVSLEDARSAARRKPLVVALSEVGSVNFASLSVSASILGVPVSLVPGFDGSQAATLAAIRNDVDLICFNFEALRESIVAGELRPLLQVSDRQIDPHPAIAGVPIMGGATGVADGPATRALIALVSSGRVVAAPPHLPSPLADCLGRAMFDTLASDELRSAARRPLDIAASEAARADVVAASAGIPHIMPAVTAALAAVRG